jgi:RNAse (barnase) inhibitor barstar
MPRSELTFGNRVVATPSEDDLVITIPAGIDRRDDLFDVLDRELQLPSYWGRNWDALDEVMSDLSWIKQRRVILVHEDVPKLDVPAQRIYLDILCTAIDGWSSDPAHELDVVFPLELKDTVEHLLETQSKGADSP